MSAATPTPRSVTEVLERLSGLVGEVRTVLVLGGEGRVVGATGRPAQDVVELVRSLAATLTAPEARVAGESARCVVTLSRHTLVVYVLGVDLAVALVGSPRLNAALATRLAEPVLVGFVDAYLPELATITAAQPAAQEPAGAEAAPEGPQAPQRPVKAPGGALSEAWWRSRPGNAPAVLDRLPLRSRRSAAHLADRVVAQRSPLKRSPLSASRQRPEIIRDPAVLESVLAGLTGL